MTHLLSGRMRTWRHNQKYKYREGDRKSVTSPSVRREGDRGSSRDSQGSDASSSCQSRSPSPPCVVDMSSPAVIDNLSTEDYVECMETCRKLVDKKAVKRNDVKSLLKKTFVKRREEIKKLNRDKALMLTSIIEDWNCFEMGDFVSILITFSVNLSFLIDVMLIFLNIIITFKSK